MALYWKFEFFPKNHKKTKNFLKNQWSQSIYLMKPSKVPGGGTYHGTMSNVPPWYVPWYIPWYVPPPGTLLPTLAAPGSKEHYECIGYLIWINFGSG